MIFSPSPFSFTSLIVPLTGYVRLYLENKHAQVLLAAAVVGFLCDQAIYLLAGHVGTSSKVMSTIFQGLHIATLIGFWLTILGFPNRYLKSGEEKGYFAIIGVWVLLMNI